MKIHSEKDEVINCPKCKERMIRIKRNSLMRIIINSKHVYCPSCYERYFKVAKVFIRLKPIYLILR